jgi:two-component system sensor histidine kinase RegB
VTMYYTGGYMNPLISLLLLPLVSAAATLQARYTWVLVLITVGAYTLLLDYFEPLQLAGGSTNLFSLHLAGMWITFVVSALMVALFVQRMSASVRERDRALAQAREQMLRQQQVAALGALAAGAAHELGTPLGTMAIIARELELDLLGDSGREAAEALGSVEKARMKDLHWIREARMKDLHGIHEARMKDLHALQQQIAACKSIVARLQSRAGSGERTPLAFDAYVNDLVEHWRLIRPGARCRVALRCQRRCSGPMPHSDRRW